MDGYLVRSDWRSAYLSWDAYNECVWWGAGDMKHAMVFRLDDACRLAEEHRAHGVLDARVVLDYYGRQIERVVLGRVS